MDTASPHLGHMGTGSASVGSGAEALLARPSRHHPRKDENWILRAMEPLALYAPYWMEFLGTFFLVLTIGMVSVPTNPNGMAGFGPLAIGATLMAAIFMGGHISGGHYNPAVTFGVWLTGRGKITTVQSLGYFVVQLIGSLIASLVVHQVTGGETFAPAPGMHITKGHAFSAEALYTFLLVSVVLNVATTKSQQDNSFYGLAIGFTVLSGAYAVGPISGGAFNPAVGFGPLVVDSIKNGSSHMNNIWIYFLGPSFGSILAAIAFRITNHHKEYRANDLAAIVESDERERERQSERERNERSERSRREEEPMGKVQN